MNILLFSRGYPSVKDVQWGCFEKDQALALKKLGHKVMFMSIDGRFRFYDRKLGISRLEDNDFIVYNLFLIPFAVLKLFGNSFFLWYLRKMTKILYSKVEKEFTPDVIYAHYLTNIYAATVIKEKTGIPLVGIEHWSMLNRDVLASSVMTMGKEAYKFVDSLISVSESLRQRILSHFSIDSVVIHNMVNLNFKNKIINGCSSSQKVFKIVSVGSLFYGKGYDVLINAFYQSKLYEKGAIITIVGEGNQRRSLEKQIKTLGLQNNIFLVGQKNKDEIVDILISSDLFVHPSRGENFSVAIIEGQAAGLPVIATLCGGATECINEKNGIIVQIGDVEGLSNALIYIYNHIDKYNKIQISDECLNKYSSSAIAQQINNVLKSVIK